jgi:hypothetical protein
MLLQNLARGVIDFAKAREKRIVILSTSSLVENAVVKLETLSERLGS